MAPIVGPVMWLGGLLAKENKNLKSDKILLEEELFTEESSTMDVDGNEEAIPVNRSTKSHSSKVDHSNKESHAMKRNDNNSRDLVVTQTVSESSEEGNHMAYQSRKTRKMSWADESGQSLDEYYVEVSPILLSKPFIIALQHALKKLRGGFAWWFPVSARRFPQHCLLASLRWFSQRFCDNSERFSIFYHVHLLEGANLKMDPHRGFAEKMRKIPWHCWTFLDTKKEFRHGLVKQFR